MTQDKKELLTQRIAGLETSVRAGADGRAIPLVLCIIARILLEIAKPEVE